MNCPVCSTVVDAQATICPHCQSDLEIYQLIIKGKTESRNRRRIVAALGLAAVVSTIGWASSGLFSKNSEVQEQVQELCPEVAPEGEIRPSPSDAELIEALRTENEELKAKNASLTRKYSPSKAKSKKGKK